jgi:3-phenylpropionate/trans-cinnamate dioxygenase ferredoxin subunit
MRTVTLAGQAVLLANLDGTFYAVDDTCSHEECSLGEGYLEDGAVECPCHGATFDVRTGEVLALPATRPIRAYPVRPVAGTAVEIDLPGDAQ